MSAIVVVHGQVRDVRDLHRRNEPGTPPGECFARSVKVLTEAEGVLGDTVQVMVWNSDRLTVATGEVVDWVVEVSVGKYGLDATFKAQSLTAVLA